MLYAGCPHTNPLRVPAGCTIPLPHVPPRPSARNRATEGWAERSSSRARFWKSLKNAAEQTSFGAQRIRCNRVSLPPGLRVLPARGARAHRLTPARGSGSSIRPGGPGPGPLAQNSRGPSRGSGRSRAQPGLHSPDQDGAPDPPFSGERETFRTTKPGVSRVAPGRAGRRLQPTGAPHFLLTFLFFGGVRVGTWSKTGS